MRYAIAALAVIAGASLATAADLGGHVTPPQAQESAGSMYRTGPYAGISLGYSTSHLTGDVVPLSADGVNVGGLAGFTFRVGHAVLGLEGDIGWQDATLSAGGIHANGGWLGTARVRAGVPIGPALLYGTAGAAFKDSIDGFTTGAVAGGGIDLQLTHSMLMRIEALHYMYPDATVSITDIDKLKLGTQDTTVRAAVIFNLN